jgi:outer membrane cobalamin receptor
LRKWLPSISRFRPANTVDKGRNSTAIYGDLEYDVTEKWLLNGAVRFENYSDFGNTTNFKVASRYKLTDNINLRGAVSTGFLLLYIKSILMLQHPICWWCTI